MVYYSRDDFRHDSNSTNLTSTRPLFCACASCIGKGFSDQILNRQSSSSLNSVPKAPTNDITIDALLPPGLPKWNSATGSAVTVTYSFMNNLPSYYSSSDIESKGFVPFNDVQKEGARRALGLWSEVSLITFVEVSDNGAGGTIRFGTAALPPDYGARASYPGTNQKNGDVWLNNTNSLNNDQSNGSLGFQIMIHEIGHAIGLKHPGNYDVGGGGTPGPYLPSNLDSRQYTVMSYTENPNRSFEPQTPMLLDIRAIQYLYGANWNTRTGNDTYSWGTNQGFVQTIWDGGGIDWISTENQINHVNINLEPGYYSYINGIDNLAIAHGVVIENATGGSGSDILLGNWANNYLVGNIGNDSLSGVYGSDSLSGGAGSDSLSGGAGSDSLSGNEENDSLYGNEENDSLYGGDGNDSLYGGDGNDEIDWEGGNDYLKWVGNNHLLGGKGNDTLLAGYGNDTLRGEDGNDELDGGFGNDELDGGSENDSLYGGKGNDTLSGDDPYIINAGNDTLRGGAGNDDISGVDGNDLIYGEDGNDNLKGAQGDDTIYGSGNDTLNGGSGNDSLINGIGNAIFYGSFGNDSIEGGSGDNYLEGNEGNDSMVGGDLKDTLIGGEGNDFLYGGWEGNDSLNGGGGNDTLDGWYRNDTLDGGGGNDLLSGGLENDLLSGGYGTDSLNGGSENDSLNGGSENDDLYGSSGNDDLNGESGNDYLSGESGNDYLLGGYGNDSLFGQAENDTLSGQVGNDTLYGGDGNDYLLGGDGNDTLSGNLGQDVIFGGAGNDIYLQAFGNSLVTGRDRLGDLAIGMDKIDLLTSSLASHPMPVSLSRAADTTASNLTVLAQEVFVDSNGSLSGNQPLGVNSAAIAVVTSGVVGTYLIVNDFGSGFNSSRDLVISITGYTGTLPVGSVAPSTLFV